MIHSAIQAAEFFIGESGTMATEAAILGTPSVFVNSLNAGVFEDEEKHGLLYSYRTAAGVLEKVRTLIGNKELKKEHLLKSQELSLHKIDTTEFLVWFIENYPQSKTTLKGDPGYQLRFK